MPIKGDVRVLRTSPQFKTFVHTNILQFARYLENIFIALTYKAMEQYINDDMRGSEVHIVTFIGILSNYTCTVQYIYMYGKKVFYYNLLSFHTLRVIFGSGVQASQNFYSRVLSFLDRQIGDRETDRGRMERDRAGERKRKSKRHEFRECDIHEEGKGGENGIPVEA